MDFTYWHDVPTIESAMMQGVGAASTCWSDLCAAGVFDDRAAHEIAKATLAEIQNILTAELATLLDPAGVATEWNDAIEKAIQLVEGRL